MSIGVIIGVSIMLLTYYIETNIYIKQWISIRTNIKIDTKFYTRIWNLSTIVTLILLIGVTLT